MNRWLIVTGLLLVAAGLMWPLLSRIPWGRLPGDISIVRENFSFHLPIASALLISVALSLVLWWLRK